MAENESGANPGATTEQTDAGAPESLLGILASGVFKFASRAPRLAADLAQKGYSNAERLALTTLRKRMDAVAAEESGLLPVKQPASEYMPRPAAPAEGPGSLTPARPAEVMAQLLEASLVQTQQSARDALALRTVRALVPDEARILAALADGHSAALVHLGAAPLVGPATQRWLENLSPVGKEAGVQLPDQTPHYIDNLRDLGLLESGEEDKSLQLKYQLIEADTRVRATCEQIEKSGMRPRFFRRTIRISDAGRVFWQTCEAIENKTW